MTLKLKHAYEDTEFYEIHEFRISKKRTHIKAFNEQNKEEIKFKIHLACGKKNRDIINFLSTQFRIPKLLELYGFDQYKLSEIIDHFPDFSKNQKEYFLLKVQ